MVKSLGVIDLFFLTYSFTDPSKSVGAGQMNCGVNGSSKRDRQRQAGRNVWLRAWVFFKLDLPLEMLSYEAAPFSISVSGWSSSFSISFGITQLILQ